MKTTRELQPRERACANAQHDLLLGILLIACKMLIFNTYCVSEMVKETNWEQQNQETPK